MWVNSELWRQRVEVLEHLPAVFEDAFLAMRVASGFRTYRVRRYPTLTYVYEGPLRVAYVTVRLTAGEEDNPTYAKRFHRNFPVVPAETKEQS